MSYSNHYFKLKSTFNDNRHINLIARGIEYISNDEVCENIIQLIAGGPVYGTSLIGEIGVWLTEKDQNKLIAGILERRGLNPEFILQLLADPYNNFDESNPISSTGDEKSIICPPED